MTTRIEISGPEHSGKTILLVALARYLVSLGANVTVQQIDPQFDRHTDAEVFELALRIKDLDILLTEFQTAC